MRMRASAARRFFRIQNGHDGLRHQVHAPLARGRWRNSVVDNCGRAASTTATTTTVTTVQRVALAATSPDDAVRDGVRAVALARQALVLQGGRTPLLLDVLAAAQAEAGDFAGARETAEEALRLARADERALVAGIEKRLSLYRSGRAYRTTQPERRPGRRGN